MSPYRRILLIMTKAQANAALDRAMALAAASGASLHVLGIHEPGELRLRHELPTTPRPCVSFVHFSTALKALLDEQPARGARPGFEAVETSDPRDLVPACIARYAPDLVIKDCSGCSLMDQRARTSLDQVLLHGSEVPLMFVPANAPAMPASVLVAVDVSHASPLNDALVMAGKQLATQCQGQLNLLSAYDLPIAMLANPDLAGPFRMGGRTVSGRHPAGSARWPWPGSPGRAGRGPASRGSPRRRPESPPCWRCRSALPASRASRPGS